MKKFLLAILFLSAFPSITMAQQASSCVDLKNNMLRGAKNANTNNEVTVLQNFLKTRGFLIATPNGSFGPSTLAAVKKFQSSIGIGSQGTPGYGGVGPKSRVKIKEMTCGGKTTSVVTPTANTTTVTIAPATQIISGVQNQPVAYQLQSEFLKNNSTAQAIASGSLNNYDMSTLPVIRGEVSTDNFGFKIISGLVQLGYVYPKAFDPSYPPYVRMLQNFEQDRGLQISSNVTQKVLQKIDTLIAERELLEAQLAKTFPLYNSMAALPLNFPTKDHVLYVYVTVFKSLPSLLANWTSENFKTFYNRHQNANPITYYFGYPAYLSLDDFTLGMNLLHEYAHYLEASGQVNTTAFYDIGWTLDPNDPTSGSRKAIPKGLVKRSQPVNPATYPNQQGFLYHEGSISQYAGGLLSGGQEEGKVNSVAEDFADSFAGYVLEGRVFRGKATGNTILSKKYNWLKDSVFQGKEYQTGNANYSTLDFQPQDKDQGFKSIPANIQDYSIMDKSFIRWDFQIN